MYESRLQRRFDVDVLDVHRDGQRLQPPQAQLRLQASDRLLLPCSRQCNLPFHKPTEIFPLQSLFS